MAGLKSVNLKQSPIKNPIEKLRHSSSIHPKL